MANNNRFSITDTFWQLSADGTTIGAEVTAESITWSGDNAFTKPSPTFTGDEAGTAIHLFLQETFYLAEDDALYACASADTYDNVGIKQVKFYYGGATPIVVNEITQRIMPDGTRVQGYWIRLDNSNTAPTGYEDRTLYAEAIPREPSTIKARVVSRTIRVMEDQSQVHVVNLDSVNLDYTNYTRPDYQTPGSNPYSPNLHGYICRYNADNSTSYKAIDLVLSPGVYTLQSVSTFPPLDLDVYSRVRSSTGNRDDVTITLSNSAPGTTAIDSDSFDPYKGDFALRNPGSILFQDITLDMYHHTAMVLSGPPDVRFEYPLGFNRCRIKDTSMSYGKEPLGRQKSAINSSQIDDPGATPIQNYSQILFKRSDWPGRVALHNSVITTIVAGGFESILNCEGAVWWDTFFTGSTREPTQIGINNFRNITTYGPNATGTDLDTERFVTNSFGLSTGGVDSLGRYYYDYPDAIGDDSIPRGTCEINRVTWIADDGTFYDTSADVTAAGKNVLEFRTYFNTAPASWPARCALIQEVDGEFGAYSGATHLYDYDFFIWKNNTALTTTNRTFAPKGISTTGIVISWIDDADWGLSPYTNAAGNRVIDGNGRVFLSWSNSRPQPSVGLGVDPKDPALPYMRVFNKARYDNPDAAPLFAAQGLDATVDTIASYYAAGGSNPVTDTAANGLLGGSAVEAINTANFEAGDRITPIYWAHQDGVQTSANTGMLANCIFHDYTSVMEQQFLFQATGEVSDVVFNNALFLDPKNENSDFLFKMENPVPMRLGLKGMTSDNFINLSTSGREADASQIHLFIEGSSITQTDGNSSSGSPAGDFDITFKDSAMGTVGTFGTTLLGRDNATTQIDSGFVAGYASNSGNKAWGVSIYGGIEQGGQLESHLTANPVTLDLGSVLPFDIKGAARTSNSLPAAIDAIETGSEGNENITTLLVENRFRVTPMGNNAVHLSPGDTAQIEYPGELLNNDAAARTYKWIVGSTVVSEGPSSTYVVQAGDVGTTVSCFVIADGVTEAVPFGVIKT